MRPCDASFVARLFWAWSRGYVSEAPGSKVATGRGAIVLQLGPNDLRRIKLVKQTPDSARCLLADILCMIE